MSKTMTAEQALEKIGEVAASNWSERLEKSLTIRDCTGMAVGQYSRQGDVYIHRVDDKHPRGKPRAERQLAIGTTQGSRHVAEEPAVVYEGATRPEWCREDAFIGPCIVVPQGETALVSHPEHAYSLHGAGTYQITHQADEATRQRVMD